jgi:hypothetical protein
MRNLSKNYLPFVLGTGLAFIICVSTTLAKDEIVPGPAPANQPPQNEEQAPPAGEDDPSFVRRHTWVGSFDRAGDATRDAELELKNNVSIKCDPEQFKTDNASPEVVQQRMATCKQKQAAAQNFGEEAAKIRSMQRIFSTTSKVSDVAAVGAIGAVGYAELVKKNQSQSETLKSAANIQETAGIVSYTTGAADFSMGAYAYMAQKKKLEKMKETLSGVSGGIQMNSEDAAVIKKLANAANETKKAAYSHMMYGAGKAAAGYASMWMAKRNREQAKSLSSLEDMQYGPQPTVSSAAPKFSNSGGVPYYPNNNPQFFIPSDGESNTSLAPTSSSAGSFGGGGASVMATDFRSPASNGAGKAGGVSVSGGSGGGAASGGAPVANPANGAEEAAANDANKAVTQGFEISLSGGNSSRYGGGGEKSSGGDSVDASQALGGGLAGSVDSRATGLNPNSLYKDALEGLDGSEEAGSMAGVNGKDQSLFDTVKTKYFKMMEVGNLQGPGAVEVKN